MNSPSNLAASQELNGADVFILNGESLTKRANDKKNAKDWKWKWKMPLHEAKVSGADEERTIQRVHQERQMNIDAAIVRTMKARGKMKKQILVMAVVQDLKRLFNCQANYVTERILALCNDDANGEGACLKALPDDEYQYQA